MRERERETNGEIKGRGGGGGGGSVGFVGYNVVNEGRTMVVSVC